MFDQFTIIFGRQWQSYTLVLSMGIILSVAWMLWRSPQDERGRVFDVCLGALIGGIVFGRAVHVILNWIFFSENINLIWQIQKEGGLNWQLTVIGALLCAYGMAKIRKVDVSRLLADAVIVLPLLALLSCFACATASCAYGLAVERMADYPNFMTWLADDIYHLNMPRFATQPLGMMASFVLLIFSMMLYTGRWLPKTRFWLILLLLSMASFGIGFLRGDYALMWFGLRAEQVLDIGVMMLSAVLIMIKVSKTKAPLNSEER